MFFPAVSEIMYKLKFNSPFATQYHRNLPFWKNYNELLFTLKVHITDQPEFTRVQVLDAIYAYVDNCCALFHHICCDEPRNTYSMSRNVGSVYS